MTKAVFNQSKAHSFVGEKHGHLTIIAAFRDTARPDHGKRSSLLCRCDCGNLVIVRQRWHLATGNTTSCGCVSGQHTHKLTPDSPEFPRIARALTALYSTWRGMKRRCSSPRDREWSLYGKRGVTVCKAWRDSYLEFARWALFEAGWAEGLTIDRLNTFLCRYCPDECRFATRKQQARNRTNNVLLCLPFLGIVCVAEAVEKLPWLGSSRRLYRAIKLRGVDSVEDEISDAIGQCDWHCVR